MTKWMRTAVLKKAVVGVLMLASLTMATERAFAAGTGAAEAGEFYRVARVPAHQTQVWRVWVPAGALVDVTVIGDGDTDLDLFVYSPTGRRLASDTDDTDICLGSFRMPMSGFIEVRIRNWGSVYNEYELLVTF
jgi:hypothetical protein